MIIYVFAHTVRAARGRNARVFLGFFNNNLNCKVINKVYESGKLIGLTRLREMARSKRISNVSR